ncbi:alpha/beta hydrolase fold domain-containing protein [Algibacter miyuki]|uniref:Alpha/beta hydrolase fold domain-containing protein n=1 Tax=Algibacter miyuki TaxID=1306933 RepID=A0ABV5GYU0_9FLAO|nr:alpha/beta hydrolase [Algibacter miyuki]MDN3666983.1 alpha/beta hydrolase [Algibacter miyuki]
MKVFKYSLINAIIAISFFNCSNNIEPVAIADIIDPYTIYEAENISYGDHDKQTFDLYLPANRNADTKIMILVHGGGWSSGDKSDMTVIKTLLTNDFPNMAVVNINYRLADTNNKPFPMQIDDIASVIKYLKVNQTKYSISDRLGFIGTSAGAHLSMLWAYTSDVLQKTDMVCSIVGPSNLTDPNFEIAAELSGELYTFLTLFGETPTDEYLEAASPYHQVSAAAPPTILFYGGQDPLIPISQGADLNNRLETLNVTHEYTLYPNAGHGWDGIDFLDTWNKLNLFINKTM